MLAFEGGVREGQSNWEGGRVNWYGWRSDAEWYVDPLLGQYSHF